MLNLAWGDQLQLAQPTVSQQIRKLEQELGVVLVRRSRSGCEPTPAAFAFMPYATPCGPGKYALARARMSASISCSPLCGDFCATMIPNCSTS
jgi:DNA-binding transcriptional ArsR family regulator